MIFWFLDFRIKILNFQNDVGDRERETGRAQDWLVQASENISQSWWVSEETYFPEVLIKINFSPKLNKRNATSAKWTTKFRMQ